MCLKGEGIKGEIRHPQVDWDKNIEEDSENDYEKEDLDLIVNVNEKVAIFKAVE